jgi:predicted lipoprotein
MNRLVAWLLAALALAILCWLLPLFHVVPLERAMKEKAAATFDPDQFAKKFWDEQLLRSLDRAVKAEVLLPEIQLDPAAARKKFSRSVGMGESYFYFISGQGRVLSATNDEVSIAITAGVTSPEIVLPTDPPFSSAVRDGTGLLDINNYPNSQDFNGISSALNRLVEMRVLSGLREQAKAGATMRFVGCAEVKDESTDLKPLRVVPIKVEVK